MDEPAPPLDELCSGLLPVLESGVTVGGLLVELLLHACPVGCGPTYWDTPEEDHTEPVPPAAKHWEVQAVFVVAPAMVDVLPEVLMQLHVATTCVYPPAV